jgi:DNA modification methylase
VKAYYDDGACSIYHGDCREVVAWSYASGVLVTDPPYGISYTSGMTGHDGGEALPGIIGDADASLRDWVLAQWGNLPAIVFGSWKVARPPCRAVLIWDKGDHVGMGDLSLPWKPNTEEIYVIGSGFSGHRGGSVLRYPAPVTWNSTKRGRQHPHEKPEALMLHLLSKCPSGVVLDPFMGSGSTLVAAKRAGRIAVGVEVDERYCEIAAERLSQGSLFVAGDDTPAVLPSSGGLFSETNTETDGQTL